MLVRLEGPECPKCGATDSELLGITTRRKTAPGGVVVSEEKIERRACRFCDRRFWAEAPPAQADVVVAPIRCPSCQGAHVVVTSTRGTLRWHRCHDCLRSFRSVELG